MENRVVWAMAALVTGFMASGPSHAQQMTNLIPNGSFETGAMTPWGSYGALATFTVVNECAGAAVPEGPIAGTYCLNVKVSGAGTNRWDAAVQPALASPPGAIFQKGKKYTLSLFLKSKTGTAQVFLAPELNQDPYTGYGVLAVTMTDKWVEYHTTTPAMPADVNPAHLTIQVAYSAQEFWIDDAKWYEGDYVPTVLGPILTASRPSPAWGDVDVPRDTALSWTPGPFANTHDVYLGGTFDDVNNASSASPASLLVGRGQTAATYATAGLLDFRQTYCWRVDEINAPPDSSIHKGRVWSFTTEPYSYPVRPAKATASSSFNATTGPEKTIDGSGLNSLDQHGTTTSDMWLSKKNQSPIWIQYEFDQVYKLDQMWVWNSNQEVEPISSFGALDVTIETSTDGVTWAVLPGVDGFNQATGLPDYEHNTTIDFSGVLAKYVRLTIGLNWAFGTKQAGLAEVRFFYVPVKAFRPAPAAGATDVALDGRLNWRPGRLAAKHQVYLGTDPNPTNLIQTTTVHSLDLGPLGLQYGKTYTWRVDEVNDTAIWPGDVWTFTTPGYAVVDDFEAYDDLCNRVFFSWQDGFGYSASPDCGVAGSPGNGSGSTVGNINPPFAEQTITYSGGKSMPMWYDNTKAPFYSETQREWPTGQAWTTGGVGTLNLWVQGEATSFLETAPGTVVMNGTGTDVWDASDQFRFVYKALKGNGSIVARVEGVGNTNEWAKAGVMIRESTAAGSTHAFVAVTPVATHGISYQRRVDTNMATNQATDVASTPVPQWVKLTRTGNAFTAQYSSDGTTWTDIKVTPALSITMSTDALIGLAVTSHQAGAVCGGKFSNVSTTGGVSGAWQMAEVGTSQVSGNTPETSYVAVADSAGKTAAVNNPDKTLIATGNWEQWVIPLSQFTSAGVNLGSVKRVIIGVGDRGVPRAGSSGKLYIDDIRLQP